MNGLQTDTTSLAPPTTLVVLAEDLPWVRRDRITPRKTTGSPLRCVSSGYLSHGCSCTETVPVDVAMAAWAHERACGGEQQGFFKFAWRGGVWLAFGLDDGRVRGVYCPEHCAERHERSLSALTADPASSRIAVAAA